MEITCRTEEGKQPNGPARVPRWAVWPGAALFLAVAGIYSYNIVFSRFARYDDQGLLMIAVRGWLNGEPLYDRVSTLYGPAYYFLQWLLHTVAFLPVSHDVTGMVCVAHWLTAALFLALAAGRMTRSVLLVFFVFVQAVLHLTNLSAEPGHPQELVALLLALGALVAARNWRSGWTPIWLGAIAAALALTKINVGVFYGIAFFLALCCHSPFCRRHPACFWVALLLASCFPLVLTRGPLVIPWEYNFGGLVCITVIATGASAYVFAGQPSVSQRDWLRVATGFTAFSISMLVLLLLFGSSFSATMDALVKRPLEMGSLFSLPLKAAGGLRSALGSLVAAVTILVMWRRAPRIHLAANILKGIYGLVGTYLLVEDTGSQLVLLLPWAWLMLVPTQTAPEPQSDNRFVRTFLCLAAAWQMLQAYPVAGTQVTVATFLAILVYSICLYDAILAFAKTPSIASQLATIPPRTAMLFTLLLFVSLLAFEVEWCVPVYHWGYRGSMPAVDLAGTRLLHLPPRERRTYQALRDYLKKECDAFVTVPGLNSMYFWTGEAPPTYFTLAESAMLSDREQQAIINVLRTSRRPLIVINLGSLNTMVGKEVRDGPLLRFMRDECREVKSLDKFRILEPKRTVPTLNGSLATALP
jgi:hypothetical protein